MYVSPLLQARKLRNYPILTFHFIQNFPEEGQVHQNMSQGLGE